MNTQRGFTTFELVISLVVMFGAAGWIWNVVKIAGSNFDTITAILVLRCIGIVIAPLGAVLGYI